MYASDYGYAASDECTQNLSSYNNTTCTSNNWLYNIKTYEWLLSQLSIININTFSVNIHGYIETAATVYNNQYAVRPVVYLTSTVKITGGDGTSSSPYTFGL